jgi:ATPase subunit of ABC transporter with duplicated ATPase domains
MSLIRLQNVTMAYESGSETANVNRVVLREIYFRLWAGERVGLIGKNGTGKTTLIKLILEQLEPVSGQVEREPNLTIGYFSQFSGLDDKRSIQAILEEQFAEIRALEAEIEQLAALLENEQDGDKQMALLERQSEVIDTITERDGWEYQRHIDTALTKLGFNATRRQQPVAELSGGWRNRAALARCLLAQPTVLLLDEPTNFLDVEGVEWLERWLGEFRGGVLLVSHDRAFLDRVVTRIVEVENYRLHDYEGNYTYYVREKPLRLKRLERQFAHEEELLVLEDESIRDRDELKREPTKSVLNKLANIKKRQTPRPVDMIVTALYQALHVSEQLCRVESVSKRYDDQQLFENLSFEVQRGDRLAIVGPNGSGKSTLLRLLNGEEGADSGRVVWPGGATFADFNALMKGLDLDDTVTHAVNVTPLAYSESRKLVHRFLAMLQFSEFDIKQRIGTLSGGQRARVALAQCLLSGASTLILDEPTNHLDVTTIQVMERALVHFPGAIIVVSHDRLFIDKIATRLLVFDGAGAVKSFDGNWTMWQAAQG